MNLRFRFLVLYLAITALFGGGLTAFYLYADSGNVRLVRSAQRHHLSQVHNVLALRSESMVSYAADYSRWDDMARFALGAPLNTVHNGKQSPIPSPTRNTAWAPANIDPCLENFKVDAIWVYDRQGRLVYFTHKPQHRALERLPESTVLLAAQRFGYPGPSLFQHFFLSLPDSKVPVEMHAASIHRTEDTRRIGDTFGYFLVGRVWDQKYIATQEQILESDIRVETDVSEISRLPSARLVYQQPLQDLEGRGIGRLHVTSRNREFESLYLHTLREGLWALLFVSAILGLSAYCIHRWVDLPLQRVLYALQTGQTASLKKLQQRPNVSAEFGRLARVVEEFSLQKQEIARSQQRLALHVEHAPLGIIEWDTDFRITAWNPAATAIFGYTSEEALGISLLDLLVPSSTRAQIEQVMHDVLARRESGERSLNQNVTRDGRTILCDWYNTPLIAPDGTVIGVASVVQDVTERQQAAEALRISEARYQNIAGNVPGIVFEYVRRADGTPIFSFVSEGVRRIAGLAPEAIQKQPQRMFGLVHPEDRAAFVGSMEESRATLQDWQWEGRFLAPSGDVRWVKSAARPTLQANGDVVWDGLIIDVSEVRQAHEALQRQKEFLRNVIDTTPDLIFVKDASGVYILANRVMAEAWGTTPEQMIGKTDYDFEDPEIVKTYRAADKRTLDLLQETFIPEEPMTGPDGSVRWMQTVKRPIVSPDTTSYQVLGIATDITHRKQYEQQLQESEERFRSSIVSMQEGLVLLDRQGVVLLCNVAAEQILGRQCQHMTGQALRDLQWSSVHPDGSPWAEEDFPIRIALEEGRAVQGGLMGVYKPNGQLVWILINAAPLFHRGETRPYAAVATFADVTEMRALTDALQKSNASLQALTTDLQRTNAALQDFAHIASHDLKEPLRKIQAFSGILQRKAGDTLNPDAREYVDRMSAAAARMQTLIEGLLVYSRTSARPREMEMVDLNQVVEEALFHPQLQNQAGDATVEVDPLPRVQGDATQLGQLLHHLIGNAYKFRRAGVPLHIRITGSLLEDCQTAAADNAPSQWVRLRISDNGIGFRPDHAERIFNLFERLVTREEGYEGTGVGLALCKKIVERHGGSIHAWGAPNEGATFEVCLPAFTLRE